MKIIDTHTHMNEERLYPQRQEIYQRAMQAGVVKVINNADTFDSFQVIDSLAQEFPSFCYSAIGIFPTEGSGQLDKDIARLEEGLAKTHNVVAVGEIGLDYHLDNSPSVKERQKALFKAQIEVAKKHNLLIIIHSRDAEADTFNTLIDSGFEGNVTLHCFSGAFQMALRYLRHKKNVYFGIGGVLTFENAKRLQEVVARVPADHFVLETDAPFLTPMPFRGQLNEPSKIVLVLDKMAQILGQDKEKLAEDIYNRSLNIYNIHE
jgi:TatD DNase family protein